MGETAKVILEVAAEHGIELFFTFIGPILVMLAYRGLDYLGERIGVEVGRDVEAKIQRLVNEAIDYAEEKAQNQVDGEEALEGHDKLQAAVEYVRENAELVGVGGLVDKHSRAISKKIEARLFDKRKTEDIENVVGDKSKEKKMLTEDEKNFE